jgi:hypothetical protein
MPVTCDTAEAPGFIRYVFVGEWTAQELLERRRELLRSGQLGATTRVLFDLRAVTRLPSLDGLHPVLYRSVEDLVWPACRAFVVSSKEQYDLAIKLQFLMGPHSVINQIFDKESTALEWLNTVGSKHGGRQDPLSS